MSVSTWKHKTHGSDVNGGKFKTKTCAVCLGECDDAIHLATLRVREWFRGQVTLALAPMKKAERRTDAGWGSTGVR